VGVCAATPLSALPVVVGVRVTGLAGGFATVMARRALGIYGVYVVWGASCAAVGWRGGGGIGPPLALGGAGWNVESMTDGVRVDGGVEGVCVEGVMAEDAVDATLGTLSG